MTKLRSRSFQMTDFQTPLTETIADVARPVGTEVLVKVKGAGICHSDLHIQEGFYELGGGEKLSFEGRVQFPFTPGHETAGEVAALGPDVTDIEVGSNVLVCSWVGCGACPACKADNEQLCTAPQFIGVNKPGGYSDYVVVPHPRYLIDIGDMDPTKAAPLACSGLTTYGAIRKFGTLAEGVPLVIVGAGGLGLMAIGLMSKMGLPAPVVVELDPSKREAALTAGARAAIDPMADDALDQIRAAVGQPVLAVLDLVGAGQTVAMGLQLLEKGGHLVVVGLLGGDVRIPVPTLPMKAITIQGSYIGSLKELRELVDLIRNRGLPAVPLDRRPLDQADSALNDLRDGKVVGRVVLVP